MKSIKILFVSLFVLALAYSIATPRFGIRTGGDNTGRTVNYGQQLLVDYKTTFTVTPTGKFEEFVKIDSISANSATGNATVVMGTTGAKQWDELTMLFDSTNNSSRVITFSTGMLATATTLTVAAQKGAIVVWKYDEGRAKWLEKLRSNGL